MRPLIIANWKMNPTSLAEAKRIFNSVKRGLKRIRNVEVVICPPFLYLPIFKGVTLGAQDCFWEEKGAFTGEISPLMLKDLGCEYVIVGHSERRKYQKEIDEMINKKIKAALKAGLKPILCIDKTSQIKKDLKEISRTELKNIVIAYEPLFAIGTGRPCGMEKAKKMNSSIKKILGRKILILYGGSVNSQNARDYIKKASFNGLLVGGASLNPKEFTGLLSIINNVALIFQQNVVRNGLLLS